MKGWASPQVDDLFPIPLFPSNCLIARDHLGSRADAPPLSLRFGATGWEAESSNPFTTP